MIESLRLEKPLRSSSETSNPALSGPPTSFRRSLRLAATAATPLATVLELHELHSFRIHISFDSTSAFEFLFQIDPIISQYTVISLGQVFTGKLPILTRVHKSS